MMEGVGADDIALFLPKWLSGDETGSLTSQLKRFPDIRFYDPTSKFSGELLQGDGWRGFIASDFDSGARKSVPGLVLSNSCDIDVANRHDTPPNILFAPLIRVAAYEALLGNLPTLSNVARGEKLRQIRSQHVSNIFYLPELPGTIPESMVVLDDVHRHPLKHFLEVATPKKVFTLSQTAFYYFLIKLSIHFTRVREGVHRYLPEPEQHAT
jgi:hypothetical protein